MLRVFCFTFEVFPAVPSRPCAGTRRPSPVPRVGPVSRPGCQPRSFAIPHQLPQAPSPLGSIVIPDLIGDPLNSGAQRREQTVLCHIAIPAPWRRPEWHIGSPIKSGMTLCAREGFSEGHDTDQCLSGPSTDEFNMPMVITGLDPVIHSVIQPAPCLADRFRYGSHGQAVG